MDIITQIITRRAELRLTQAQLAMLSGLKPTVLSRIEAGKVSPNLRTLSKIAKAVGGQVALKQY